MNVRLPDLRMNAPDFPTSFEWLNTDTPLSLDEDLRGHVVLLDFWTYCCINCMHILPDLEYLEEKYADQPLVVLGVHSAKFDNEKDRENILAAIHRYRIKHPVIVDQEHRIWSQYGVRAWPTFVLIDPTGKVVARLSGEGHRERLDQTISALLEEGREKDTLAEEPLRLTSEDAQKSERPLAFPGKVTADTDNKRLLIADSNHNRILVTDPEGQVQHVIGSGTRGFQDGDFTTAQFANPQGIAVHGDTIYVADTDNHAIRRVDLDSGQVDTLAGTGEQGYDRRGGKIGPQQILSSPWDVAVHDDRLYIAMAGLHQLWVHDLNTGVTQAWAGSGAEDLQDGPAPHAALAQPSGLAVLGDSLYFADSEVSAIRQADLDSGRVHTLAGTGLFDFGHRDGDLKQALLQHPLGIAALNDRTLAIADTYNHRIRLIDLEARQIRTLYGGDEEQLFEPGGLAVLDGQIYVADTNHHRILRLDPTTNQAKPLEIRFPQP